MKPSIYIASCSFGKDSIATILLALENGEPLDRVVFAEVKADNEAEAFELAQCGDGAVTINKCDWEIGNQIE